MSNAQLSLACLCERVTIEEKTVSWKEKSEPHGRVQRREFGKYPGAGGRGHHHFYVVIWHNGAQRFSSSGGIPLAGGYVGSSRVEYAACRSGNTYFENCGYPESCAGTLYGCSFAEFE